MDINEKKQQEKEEFKALTPKDEYNAVYFSFILLGAGFLFPWNAVITAADYWFDVYHGTQMFFWFTVIYMTANVLGLIIVVFAGERVSFAWRIVPGFALFTVVVIILPFMNTNILAYVAIALIAVLGCADAIVQGSLFGLVGQFDPRYTNALMTGNGVAGVAVGVLRVITKSIPVVTLFQGALLYFFVSAAVLFSCIIVYLLVLQKSPVTQYYLKASQHKRISTMVGENKPLLSDATEAPHHSHVNRTDLEHQRHHEVTKPSSFLHVFSKVWSMALCAGFNLWLTLSLFPGLTATIPSTYEELNTTNWMAIILVFEFNIFDLIGRYIPKFERLILFNTRTLWIPSLLRLVFFPLFILQLHPRLIKADYLAYIFMALFAGTNGYCATLSMMFGPDLVENKDKERAGNLMIFCLTIGLTAGVWTGNGLNSLLSP